jgi:cysteine desulfurase
VRVPVDAQGRVDVDRFCDAVDSNSTLAVLMGAQTEVGTLMPVAEVAARIEVPLLCDAVQLAGRVPLALGELGCAAAVISSHKIGGPHGCGALWVAPGRALRPYLAGGPQERGRRAGTENVLGIVGFGAAASVLPERLGHMPRLAALRDGFEVAIGRIDGAVVHGQAADRLPNTSAFRFEGVDGDLLLAALDLEGYCLSSGSACSAGAVEPSSTLQALGLSPAQARGGLRVSLGPSSTAAEVEGCAAILPQLVARIRAQGACA